MKERKFITIFFIIMVYSHSLIAQVVNVEKKKKGGC